LAHIYASELYPLTHRDLKHEAKSGVMLRASSEVGLQIRLIHAAKFLDDFLIN
jgi:hypothetical protein